MSGTTTSTRRARPLLFLPGLALLVAGCGSTSGVGPTAAGDESAGPLVRVLYAYEPPGGDWSRVEVDALVQGSARSRTELRMYGDGPSPDETVVIVRDGNRALLVDDAAEPAYTVLEAVDEHPDELFRQAEPLVPGSDAFRDLCPSAEPTAPRTILGRTALGHTCAWEDPDPELWQAGSIWLDGATGMVLEHGQLRAVAIEDDPGVDADAFSTTPPEDAEVKVVEASGTGPPAGEEGPGVDPVRALRTIAASSAAPVYHLGPEFEGEPLSRVAVFDRGPGREAVGDLDVGPGQDLTLFYGEDLEIQQEPFDAESYRVAAGCSRLAPLRGVPTARQSDAVWLFTGDRVIRIGSLSDPEDAAPVAAALHEVGRGRGDEDLPAPPADIVALVDTACGATPGEHGPPIDE